MRSRSSLRVFAIAVAVCLFCMPAIGHAKTAVIYLKDRVTPIKGEWVGESTRSVTITVAGIQQTIERDRIERIEWELDFPDEYKAKRAEVADDDIPARYQLARWAYSQNSASADTIALKELNGILAIQPDSQESILLRKLVTQRIKNRNAHLRDQRNQQTNTQRPANTRPDPDKKDDQPATKLTDEQSNLIKVFELDLESSPRLQIPHKVLTDFWDKYRADDALLDYQGRTGRNRFVTLDRPDQLEIMFQAKAREFYPLVKVQTEPEPLKEFRVKWNQALVARNLMQHFSEELDGVVYLVGADRPTSEENAYTNFLMLHRASLDGRKFIDRAQPRDSLLLQWALPRDIAKYPAPEVKGWRPYFTGLNDRRVRDFENWVRSLYSPAPIYPIDFDPEPEEEEAEATESAQAEP